MPRLALTDRFVLGAKSDHTPQTDYFDSKTPGLALRVSNGGHKAWTFIFTAPTTGKRTRVTLGSYPALSLSAARTKASEARGRLQDGGDPRAVQRHGVAEITVAELVNRYVADPDKARLRSIKEIKRRLDRNALPVIGSISLAQLTRRDVRDVTDKIMKRGAITQAWHTHKDLSAVLRWATRNDFLTHNPIEGTKAPGGFTAGERTLSDDEISALWHVLPVALTKSKSCQRIIKLCLVTGQRLGEVSGMTRAELDLDHKLWSLPGARTKNKFPHTVPLSDLSVTLIQEALADIEDDCQFVFPAEDGSGLTAPRVTRAISRAHDFQRRKTAWTFRNIGMVGARFAKNCSYKFSQVGCDTACHRAHCQSSFANQERCHLRALHSTQLRRRKRSALNLWSDRLAAIVGDQKTASVVPLRRRQAAP